MAREALELCLHGVNIDTLPTRREAEDIEVNSNEKVVEIIVSLQIKDGKLFCEDAIEFTEENEIM